MGRMHPSYCEHGVMIDGGSFYENDELLPCKECVKASDDAVKADAWVAHVEAHRRIKELEHKLTTAVNALRAIRDGIPGPKLHAVDTLTKLAYEDETTGDSDR